MFCISKVVTLMNRIPGSGIVFLGFAFLLGACSTPEDQYGLVELFHGKPLLPRMVPRQMLGPLPTGPFPNHRITGILIMDSGADYQGETALTYMTNLLRRYKSLKNGGDLPFHYFIEPSGKIFAGRQEFVPALLHKEDPFLFRMNEVSKKDILLKRLSRETKEKIDIDGYVTIVMLGDFDQNMVSEAQEKALFQLVAYVAFDYYIPRERIIGLHSLYPEYNNPGFYLKNYLNQQVLKENIPEPPKRPAYLQVPSR